MNNIKKYLPSKRFVSTIIIIVVLIAMFFVAKGIISFFKNQKGLNNNVEIVEETVGNIIGKDSNNNGIADWEEYLWGLDPNKNGPGNKEYILSKKKSLVQNGEMLPTDDSSMITDNEMLSRQFFATIISLQQTGDLNQESINSVSETIGKNIEITPIADIYTKDMLTIKGDSASANAIYSDALANLITKYGDSDIGTELTLIVQGLSNKDSQALFAATTIGDAYQSFGKDLIKIPVPASLSTIHLNTANNYQKVGETIKDLAQILSDPLIGMKSIISYKQYSDELYSNLEKISGILQ